MKTSWKCKPKNVSKIYLIDAGQNEQKLKVKE